MYTNQVFVVPVKDRTALTLLAVIHQKIFPGAIIYDWSGYINLKNESYQCITINHSENFINPVTGVYIQNIERF